MRNSRRTRRSSRSGRLVRTSKSNCHRGGEPSSRTCDYCMKIQCNLDGTPSFCKNCNLDKAANCRNNQLTPEIREKLTKPRMDTNFTNDMELDAAKGILEAAASEFFSSTSFLGQKSISLLKKETTSDTLTSFKKDYLKVYLNETLEIVYMILDKAFNENSQYNQQQGIKFTKIQTPSDIYQIIQSIRFTVNSFERVIELTKKTKDSELYEKVKIELKELLPSTDYGQTNPFGDYTTPDNFEKLSSKAQRFIYMFFDYTPSSKNVSVKMDFMKQLKAIIHKKDVEIEDQGLRIRTYAEQQKMGFIDPIAMKKVREEQRAHYTAELSSKTKIPSPVKPRSTKTQVNQAQPEQLAQSDKHVEQKTLTMNGPPPMLSELINEGKLVPVKQKTLQTVQTQPSSIQSVVEQKMASPKLETPAVLKSPQKVSSSPQKISSSPKIRTLRTPIQRTQTLAQTMRILSKTARSKSKDVGSPSKDVAPSLKTVTSPMDVSVDIPQVREKSKKDVSVGISPVFSEPVSNQVRQNFVQRISHEVPYRSRTEIRKIMVEHARRESEKRRLAKEQYERARRVATKDLTGFRKLGRRISNYISKKISRKDGSKRYE